MTERKHFTRREFLRKSPVVTRKNPRAKKVKSATVPKGLFGFELPSWERIKVRLERLPVGWRSELAEHLRVKPSAVTMFMTRSGQPSYQRVADILAWLQSKKGIGPDDI